MTDHIAEAEAWMTEYSTIVEGEGLTDATVIASPLAAIAHATIALAEQQRIANQLAYAQLNWSGHDGRSITVTAEAVLQVISEVGEALGMETVRAWS